MKQNKSFLVIGITGGAGSGKTTVVEKIKEFVATEFIHCDVIAHELMEPGGASYYALIKEYGKEILEGATEGAKISREKLAKVALATQERAKRLNAITHPLVKQKVEERLQELDEESFCGIAVIEAALLIEAGYQDMCDELWYVQAPLEERVARMKENRGYTEEKIAGILKAQLSEEEFLRHADFVIQNPNLNDEEQKEHLMRQIAPHLKEKLESRGMICYNK